MPLCHLNGICGSQPPKNLKKAIEDPVLAPFVEVQIKDGSGAVVAQARGIANEIYDGNPVQIGVGNKSFPAVVKSLQVGTSRGAGADIEILDQEAGDFRTIFEKVSRMGTASDNLCWVRWGWISTKCDGSTVPISGEISDPEAQPVSGMVSCFHTYQIYQISVDYSAGCVKYTLRCTDVIQTLRDTKIPGVIPPDGSPMHFVDAVNKVLQERGLKAQFKAFSSATTETQFRFKVTDTGNMDPIKGMLRIGGWRGDNRNVLEALQEWARPHVVDIGGGDGRGIRVYFDPTNCDRSSPNGTVVFMADTTEHCPQGTANTSSFEVGTYVINGGNCYPVINFKPQIGFTGTVAYTTGGTGGGASSPGTKPNNGPAGCLATPKAMPHLYPKEGTNSGSQALRVGHNVSITLLRDERLGRNRRAMRYAYNNMYMNSLSTLPISPIQAELKVQGDPTFNHPLQYVSRFLRLIVINPFQIEEVAPCEWGNSVQPCNEILSVNSWIIQGVFHDIRAGSYTTTFKLMLATPGYDRPDSAPLGP